MSKENIKVHMQSYYDFLQNMTLIKTICEIIKSFSLPYTVHNLKKEIFLSLEFENGLDYGHCDAFLPIN